MIRATRTQWIKFAVVLALYLIFLVWLRSWLGLVVVPFIFDAYITKKIPWTWWRESKNRHVVTVMGWVDAIVFALVAVYFVNLYFFQNYVIPSSSLEKSLLTGDYLFVSKMSYGPRVPQTPLHMPLAQHTLPFFNCKSYLEHPQWDYKRVKGLGDFLIEFSLRQANLPNLLQLPLKVFIGEHMAFFQPVNIHCPTLNSMVFDDLSRPFAELHSPLIVHLEAYGNNRLQVIMVCIIVFSV